MVKEVEKLIKSRLFYSVLGPFSRHQRVGSVFTNLFRILDTSFLHLWLTVDDIRVDSFTPSLGQSFAISWMLFVLQLIQGDEHKFPSRIGLTVHESNKKQHHHSTFDSTRK